jgi:hypothetical protein
MKRASAQQRPQGGQHTHHAPVSIQSASYSVERISICAVQTAAWMVVGSEPFVGTPQPARYRLYAPAPASIPTASAVALPSRWQLYSDERADGERPRETAHFIHNMDKFHATELQQHKCSCESQVSPGVVEANWPTASRARHQHRRTAHTAAAEARTAGIAYLAQALVRPAWALADDGRVPVELVRRAHGRVVLGDRGARRGQNREREHAPAREQ